MYLSEEISAMKIGTLTLAAPAIKPMSNRAAYNQCTFCAKIVSHKAVFGFVIDRSENYKKSVFVLSKLHKMSFEATYNNGNSQK